MRQKAGTRMESRPPLICFLVDPFRDRTSWTGLREWKNSGPRLFLSISFPVRGPQLQSALQKCHLCLDFDVPQSARTQRQTLQAEREPSGRRPAMREAFNSGSDQPGPSGMGTGNLGSIGGEHCQFACLCETNGCRINQMKLLKRLCSVAGKQIGACKIIGATLKMQRDI